MKRYIKYIISVLSLSCIVSCVQNDEIANPNDGGQMSLRLVSSTMTRSADDTAGLNEDLLVKADLYLFEADANGDAKGASLWHETFDEFNAETGTNGGATLPVFNIPANVLSKLGSSAKLYVIANYNGSDALPESATLAALQKQAVAEAKWGQTDKDGDWVPQSSFVMDGIGDVSVNNNSLTGTIYLTRAAAKIELTITGFTGVPAGGVQDASGAHWLPNFSDENKTSISASVKLLNAVANSYVGAPMAAGSYKYDATTAVDGFYTYGTKADNGSYSQLIPFYSYSSDWTAAGGANRASLLLVVPWKKVGTTEVQNCYYEIPIGTRENNLIERNKHYKIGVNVGTLGSFAPSTNVTITPAYITVVDWSTGQTDVSISEARYLVVDEKKVVMNNVDSYSVTYATSHDVTAVIKSIEFYDLTGNTAQLKTFDADDFTVSADGSTYSFTYDSRTYTFSISYADGQLTLTHVLQNDKDKANFDYVPYTVYANIHHSESGYTEKFSEDVEFIQYPAMYITAYQNPDYTDGSGSGKTNDNKGYMFVNGYTGNDSGTYPTGYKTVSSVYVQCLGSANGLTSTTNANPNSYLLTLSSFANNTYVIGDPRTEDVDTTLRDATFTPGGSSSKTIWVSAPALDGTTRTLKYPYPTRATADTKNMIAPQIRVASSYSVLSANFVKQKEIARRRCASYQEAGYPAGRWRLPTKAEAEYMVKLSAEGLIPKLYSSGYSYWCAHGYFVPYNEASGTHAAGDVVYTESDTNSGASVRCVYDVWYWGDGRISDISTFTWGDQPR